MRKTYITNMPDQAGAFLTATRVITEAGGNIVRVNYNRAVDTHTLLIEVDATEEQQEIISKRLEEVIRVGDPYPLFIDRNSQALRVLQQIRDEAHRFGITFHRNLRSKAAIHSALRDIKGVGEKTEQRLLLHYGSVARIAAAPLEDLSAQVGADLAMRIHDYLNSE